MDESPVIVPRPVPKRIRHPAMAVISKEACASGGPESKMVIEAEYKGRVMKMDLAGEICYTLKALKSRVCL